MTFAVERHEGNSLWLVAIDKGVSQRLAKFTDAATVQVWKSLLNAALLAARESGRQGL